jgi:hypothetical protein
MRINKLIKLIEAEYKKNKQEEIVLDGIDLQKIELCEIKTKHKKYINLNCEMLSDLDTTCFTMTNLPTKSFTTYTFANRLNEIKKTYGNLKIFSNEYKIYRVTNVNGLLNIDTFKYNTHVDIKDIT